MDLLRENEWELPRETPAPAAGGPTGEGSPAPPPRLRCDLPFTQVPRGEAASAGPSLQSSSGDSQVGPPGSKDLVNTKSYLQSLCRGATAVVLFWGSLSPLQFDSRTVSPIIDFLLHLSSFSL